MSAPDIRLRVRRLQVDLAAAGGGELSEQAVADALAALLNGGAAGRAGVAAPIWLGPVAAAVATRLPSANGGEGES